jgi:hypothetical protein
MSSVSNEEERRKDAHDREAIVAHLKEQLRNGDKSLVGNKGYRRYLKVEGSAHFVIDEKQVKAEERYDGFWVKPCNRSTPLFRTNAFCFAVNSPVRIQRHCGLPESPHPQRGASCLKTANLAKM